MNAAFDALLNGAGTNTPNYMEFVLLSKEINNLEYSYDIDQSIFTTSMKAISKKFHIKYFVKKVKRYRINDMHMEVDRDTESETKIFRMTNISSCIAGDKLLCVGFLREKMPYHMFPCTMNIDEVCYIQRLTFRLHNRLFLNYEIQKYDDDRQIYKIYLNYNHDKASEMSLIMDTTTQYVTQLLA